MLISKETHHLLRVLTYILVVGAGGVAILTIPILVVFESELLNKLTFLSVLFLNLIAIVALILKEDKIRGLLVTERERTHEKLLDQLRADFRTPTIFSLKTFKQEVEKIRQGQTSKYRNVTDRVLDVYLQTLDSGLDYFSEDEQGSIQKELVNLLDAPFVPKQKLVLNLTVRRARFGRNFYMTAEHFSRGTNTVSDRLAELAKTGVYSWEDIPQNKEDYQYFLQDRDWLKEAFSVSSSVDNRLFGIFWAGNDLKFDYQKNLQIFQKVINYDTSSKEILVTLLEDHRQKTRLFFEDVEEQMKIALAFK